MQPASRVIATSLAAEEVHPEAGGVTILAAGTVVFVLAETDGTVTFSVDVSAPYPHSAWFKAPADVFEAATAEVKTRGV